MQYSLLIYRSPEDFARRDDPAQGAAFRESWAVFLNELRVAGIPADSASLQQPGSAVTLRLRNGRPLVEDGPYADTREQLAGIITIDVPDIADAVAWMWRCPAVLTGIVELRPHLPAWHAARTDAAGCCGGSMIASKMQSASDVMQ